MAIFDPHTTQPITKTIGTGDYVGGPTAVPNLVQIRPWGLLDKWVKYNEFFYLYLFFGDLPTGQTRRRIFTLDGSNDADSRRCVPFGDFVDIALNLFGVKFPPKP